MLPSVYHIPLILVLYIYLNLYMSAFLLVQKCGYKDIRLYMTEWNYVIFNNEILGMPNNLSVTHSR